MGRRFRRGAAAGVVAAAPEPVPDVDDSDRDTPLAVAIVVAVVINAIPLWGVLAGEWSIGALMVLFWIENVFAGLAQAARMAALPGPTVPHGMKFAVIPFFLFHYGGFAFVHALFVFAQFVPEGAPVWHERGFWLAVIAAAAVQAWQAWQAHRAYVPPVVTEEERKAGHKDPKVAREQVQPLARLMAEPYLRVGILHVVIIFGAMLAMMFGTPLASLLLLIALKGVYEVAQATGAIRRVLATSR